LVLAKESPPRLQPFFSYSFKHQYPGTADGRFVLVVSDPLPTLGKPPPPRLFSGLFEFPPTVFIWGDVLSPVPGASLAKPGFCEYVILMHSCSLFSPFGTLSV